jgi:hypothetical protein
MNDTPVKTPGQIWYEAWVTTVGDVCIPWDDLTPLRQDGYDTSARAVIAAQPCPHPYSEVRPDREEIQPDGEVHWTMKCIKCGREF